MDVLLIVDMQEGINLGNKKQDLSGVVERINRLSERIRKNNGQVIFIQHDGIPEDGFQPFTQGWKILNTIQFEEKDLTVRKTKNDAFWETNLQTILEKLKVHRVIICGWATDLCVDATIRSAVNLGFNVIVPSDCHTVSDRPHLDATTVMEHHHWIWTNLISKKQVKIVSEAEIKINPNDAEPKNQADTKNQRNFTVD